MTLVILQKKIIITQTNRAYEKIVSVAFSRFHEHDERATLATFSSTPISIRRLTFSSHSGTLYGPGTEKDCSSNYNLPRIISKLIKQSKTLMTSSLASQILCCCTTFTR